VAAEHERPAEPVDDDRTRDEVPSSEEPGVVHPPAGTAVSARTHEEGTVGSDLRFFEPAEPGSLKDQRDLIDEDGDDIRMYTGEPVETDDGWILPQQQNQPGNSAGGGEYPDPATPSTQPGKPSQRGTTTQDRAATERPDVPDRQDDPDRDDPERRDAAE
jgi:hypothetical protein